MSAQEVRMMEGVLSRLLDSNGEKDRKPQQ
jgi:hypothetical protein